MLTHGAHLPTSADVLTRLSLIAVILFSQASHSTCQIPRAVKYVAGVAAVVGAVEGVLYGTCFAQKNWQLEVENMSRAHWDAIYAFMRATMYIVPRPVKDIFGKKDYSQLYTSIVKVHFSEGDGGVFAGLSERLVNLGIIEDGDIISHPLNEHPQWMIDLFRSKFGVELEDYTGYTHWAVYQASPVAKGQKKAGRIIDFDTRTAPRTPSLERYLIERSEQGKKYIWVMKPANKDLAGMAQRVANVLKNEGEDYRLAHASPDFRVTGWWGDNCESVSYEIATGWAYSEQSAAWRTFTYLFTGAVVGAVSTVVGYRLLRR